jgi:cobalamin biosynthetic protein CobC
MLGAGDRLSDPVPHGGSLARARQRWPGAPEPWLDLSTGISPFPYPLPAFPPESLTRLPEPAELARLCALAARRFGAAEAEVVAAPGTGVLLPLVAALVPRGRAVVVGPTYAEHARAAALAGHEVAELTEPEPAALLTVVNPNNPDGRVWPRRVLRELAAAQRARGGLLVVDEAFMEAAAEDQSMAPEVSAGGVVVLRSFGKFHGLAGVRLGFAVAAPAVAARLRAWLGPWAVSGPALAAGLAAYGDAGWPEAARRQLEDAAAALDAVLEGARCRVVGGTALFRLAEVPEGTEDRLGRAGILTRAFPFWPDRLRFGIPSDASARARLAAALA